MSFPDTSAERRALERFWVMKASFTGRPYYTFTLSRRFHEWPEAGDKEFVRRVFEESHELDLVPDRPLPIRVGRGGRRADLHSFLATMELAGQRLLELLMAFSAGSIRPHPVVVYDRKDREGLDIELWWLRIAPRGGPADRTRGLFLLQQAGWWHRDLELRDGHGLYFDVDPWDGSDVFVLPNYGVPIVTERVASAIRTAGLKNVILTPVLDYGRGTRDYAVAAMKRRLEREGRLPEAPAASPGGARR